MMSARPLAVPFVTLGAALAIACGPKQIAAPTRPGQTLIVLLPDADTGSTGRATVSNKSGSADLAAEGAATLATANRRPGSIATLSDEDMTRLFGGALSAMPPPPRRFTLYFQFESDNLLTVESLALVPEVLNTFKDRSLDEISIAGHTDTMGTPPANFDLGLRRALFVRDLLVQAGLHPSNMEVTSHGEADLLIRTPDETPEPGNRRVEISIR
jgi:outer membrane protein OmpA-like peptidoglycan-associated protein